jgi:hypothetical protein
MVQETKKGIARAEGIKEATKANKPCHHPFLYMRLTVCASRCDGRVRVSCRANRHDDRVSTQVYDDGKSTWEQGAKRGKTMAGSGKATPHARNWHWQANVPRQS